MSSIITTTVYTLDELSCPSAREKARDWYRVHHSDSNWYENVYEDFRAVCGIFGIDLRQRVFRLSNGRFMEEPCIWFSGFCSQGDGACFEGRWHWQSATARRLREYATQDHELHRIADALQAVQKRNFWQLQAEIHHRGRYCHPYSMDITVTRNSPTGQAMTADAEAAVSEALRDLAFWLYRQLENEYDRLTSDAAVDEALLINEYTFTEAGLRAGLPEDFIVSDKLHETNYPDDHNDRLWWGLLCTVTPCFGARLVQEGNRLHYLVDRAGIRGLFSDADAYHLDQAFPLLMKQLELMLTCGELNPRHQHTVTLYAKGLTCEADTLGSCGYVYLAVYPTPETKK
ncbi:hypothetical protein VEE48_07310 [Escherichia coli]|nr:hypothetical protein VEE48_07310 [Escherichia coli]